MSEQKKPAGWKSAQGTFWLRTGEQRCKQCLRISVQGAEGVHAHDRACDEWPRSSAVRGPDLPAPVERFDHEAPIAVVMRQIEKPKPAERSEVYMEWVRRGHCLNCGAAPRNDPHHEDTTIAGLRRGVRLKARDQLTVSLCRKCHDSLTAVGGGYRLPNAATGGEHTAEESKAIIHDAQAERLHWAVSLLPLEWKIEALSAGIARVPEAVLRKALLTGDADERLAEALDSAGEDL